MKEEWVRQIRKRAEEDRLIVDPNIGSLLYRWRDYSGSLDEPREWIVDAIRTDDAFAELVNGLISRGTTHSVSDSVATPLNTFERKTIEDFVGIDVARTKCDGMDITRFPIELDALRTLRHHLSKWQAIPDQATTRP